MKALLLAGLMTFGAIASQASVGGSQENIAPLTEVVLANGTSVLATETGLTVYIFDKDQGSTSSCYDACARAWPPVLAAANVTLGVDIGLTVRKDGTQQLTHQGRPLYLYVGDEQKGDITGDGIGGVWHIIQL